MGEEKQSVYSRMTTAPCASKAFLIFSASSFGMPSLSTFGTDSTNFFAYIERTTRLKKGAKHGNRKTKAHLDEGEVRHHRLDLLDDLGLRTGVERLELHVENHLFLWLGRSRRIFACGRVVCACACGRSEGGACCGQGDFLDVQTSLCVRIKKKKIGF